MQMEFRLVNAINGVRITLCPRFHVEEQIERFLFSRRESFVAISRAIFFKTQGLQGIALITPRWILNRCYLEIWEYSFQSIIDGGQRGRHGLLPCVWCRHRSPVCKM